MAGAGSAVLSAVILMLIVVGGLYIFFEVLGYSPSNTGGGAVAK